MLQKLSAFVDSINFYKRASERFYNLIKQGGRGRMFNHATGKWIEWDTTDPENIKITSGGGTESIRTWNNKEDFLRSTMADPLFFRNQDNARTFFTHNPVASLGEDSKGRAALLVGAGVPVVSYGSGGERTVQALMAPRTFTFADGSSITVGPTSYRLPMKQVTVDGKTYHLIDEDAAAQMLERRFGLPSERQLGEMDPQHARAAYQDRIQRLQEGRAKALANAQYAARNEVISELPVAPETAALRLALARTRNPEERERLLREHGYGHRLDAYVHKAMKRYDQTINNADAAFNAAVNRYNSMAGAVNNMRQEIRGRVKDMSTLWWNNQPNALFHPASGNATYQDILNALGLRR